MHVNQSTVSGSPLAGQRVKRDSVLAQDTVDAQCHHPTSLLQFGAQAAVGGKGTSVACPMALEPAQAWCGVIGWSRYQNPCPSTTPWPQPSRRPCSCIIHSTLPYKFSPTAHQGGTGLLARPHPPTAHHPTPPPPPTPPHQPTTNFYHQPNSCTPRFAPKALIRTYCDAAVFVQLVLEIQFSLV